jgi:hypothetical protein
MEPDDSATPPLLTRIGWFFWAGWNRVLCAVSGHRPDPDNFCDRCGLPLPPFETSA